ncbi:hypothetical protein GCM10011495_04000 [Hymenobacter frigidus]|uniref:Uncharacterized protein n=1 Tax=Hymenobacter frigidus TaxID=1524095 RepID=A0ABQ1ZVK8_9BACT|nr:hypothetical protein GCM10011495_04000 [Hymenobacter frigidus]
MLYYVQHDGLGFRLLMVVVMGLIGLAEQIKKRATDVKSRPAHIQPIEAGGGVAYGKVQD